MLKTAEAIRKKNNIAKYKKGEAGVGSAFFAQLRKMMHNASGEKEREAIARCIDTIDRM